MSKPPIEIPSILRPQDHRAHVLDLLRDLLVLLSFPSWTREKQEEAIALLNAMKSLPGPMYSKCQLEINPELLRTECTILMSFGEPTALV